MLKAFVKNGSVNCTEIPSPQISDGCIKIKVKYSAISSGTEMSSVISAEGGLIKHALSDPKKIFKVLDVFKTQGFANAKAKVTASSEKLEGIGYSVVGEIIDIGKDVVDFQVGDLVCAGGATANHAEEVLVPKNLVVKVPDGVPLQYASTATIGSIVVNGIHRANLTTGEYAVVFGAGLLGLIATQILKNSGVRVACVDISDYRLQIAKQVGIEYTVNPLSEDPVMGVQNWSNGYGADAVLFFASTHNDEPLSQAFRMCRKKGKVVLVGVSGMNIKRSDIYKNEVDLLISTSYGPGRYDTGYENDGVDYPYAYVRWTENRNMAEYLRLIKNRYINLDILEPKIYPIKEINTAYSQIKSNPSQNVLTILEYDHNRGIQCNRLEVKPTCKVNHDIITVGMIGVGSFATNVILPIIFANKSKFRLKTVSCRTGEKAVAVAKQFGGEIATSDVNDIFSDEEIDLVVICTRHDTHARFVIEALKHKKNVYVEKPLAVSVEELDSIVSVYESFDAHERPNVMVGFNRRFSPLVSEIKKKIENRVSPLLLRYRMNAGYVPYDFWIHKNGGRIIGEACHIIDLSNYLVGSSPKNFSVNSIAPSSGMFKSADNKNIVITYSDGSMAVIDYFSCGSKLLPKEYMELHFDGKSILMDDYKTIVGYGLKIKYNSSVSEKGHKEEWMALYNSLKTGDPLIDFKDLVIATNLSLMAAKEK